MAIAPLTPERRRQQTRDLLIRAATQVFAEHGFHGASLDQVAALAGFTKGAVYSNFENKDELFVAVLEARFLEDMAALQTALDATADEPEAHVVDFVAYLRTQFTETTDLWGSLYLEFCLYARRHPDVREKLARLQRADIEAVASIIESQRQRHSITSSEPAEHLARIVQALFRGLGNLRLVDAAAVDEPLLESMMTFLTRAMLPPEWVPPNG